MLPAELVATYPHIFHMAEESAWEGIQRHGLLSTEALVDLFETPNPRRNRLLSERRPDMTAVLHDVHGSALIRDNGPLNEKKLAACLIDMTVPEFLHLINSKVFFWPTEKRLQTLFEAPAYRDRPHLILTIDTASLLAAHAERVTLSPINSGATVHNAPRRGSETFKTIADYDFEYWRTKRSRPTAVAEICVDHSVPDVISHLVEAYVRHPDGSVEQAN
ncbi:DUF7002 family protein [Demequina aurantiaca]|uniref:DUF7002 family protein n=1 Tax=Demequina aurantiaca TaxID=676200 RepID=UPI003D329F21